MGYLIDIDLLSTRITTYTKAEADAPEIQEAATPAGALKEAPPACQQKELNFAPPSLAAAKTD